MGVTNGKAEGRRAREETAQMGLGACGNIVDERFCGQDKGIVRGTKHFKPGTGDCGSCYIRETMARNAVWAWCPL